MKRWMYLLLAMGLGAATVAPPALADATTRTRMETARYKGPSLTPHGFHICTRDATITCVRFTTKKHEQYVSLDVTDAADQYLNVVFEQPGTDVVGSFCDRTDRPLRIEGGAPLHVYIYGGTEGESCNGNTATVGIVEATFSTGGGGR